MLPSSSSNTNHPLTKLAHSLKRNGKFATTYSSKYRVESSRRGAGNWYQNMPVGGQTASITDAGTSGSVAQAAPAQSLQSNVIEPSRSDVNMHSPGDDLPPPDVSSDEDNDQQDDQEQQNPDEDQEDEQDSVEFDEYEETSDGRYLRERLRRFEDHATAIFDKISAAMDKITAVQQIARPSDVQLAKFSLKRGIPTQRKVDLVQRHRHIREHMARLMKQNGVVAEEVATAYENSVLIGNRDDCCTAEDFQVALTGHPCRQWNRSAAVVFARSFREAYGIDPQHGEMETIIKQALVRIKGMFRTSRKGALPRRSSKKMDQRNRRAGRKETKRLKVCMEHPLLQQHVNFIRTLGRNGMSSDESDHGEVATNIMASTRPTRFYVLVPNWRHAEVARFFEVIDTIGFVSRRRSGERKRGAFFRTRIHANGRLKISKNKNFVSGLPINVYDPFWLDGRNDVDIYVYPQSTPYNLVHDPRVLEYIYAENQEDDDEEDGDSTDGDLY